MTSLLVTLLVAAIGFHFQSLIKNTNEIKRSVRRSKTAVTALIDAHAVSPPTQAKFAAVLPRSPGPLLSKRLEVLCTCCRRRIERNRLKINHRVRSLMRSAAGRCAAVVSWLRIKRHARSGRTTTLLLPPKLYGYETSYASLTPDTEQGLTVDDVQLDWRAAPDAREAVRLCGIEFAVDTEDLLTPESSPLGPPGKDFYVYWSERCIIWARPMTKRFGRRPR